MLVDTYIFPKCIYWNLEGLGSERVFNSEHYADQIM